MQVELLGPARIIKPSAEMTMVIRAEARAHMLGRFQVGTYTDSTAANAILQHQYDFYAGRLLHTVSRIAGRDSLEFALTQYDQAALVLHGKDIDDAHARERWLEHEGDFRRAMKHLAELITINGPATSRPSKQEWYVAMDFCLLAAETMASLSEMSHRVHGIFAEGATLTIHSDGNGLDWEVHIGGKFAGYDRRIADRVARDRQHRMTFFEGHQFDIHTDRHAEILNSAFESEFGWSYARFISALWHLIDGAMPAPGAMPTLFINRRTVEAFFASHGEPARAVTAMLDGFTVTSERMRAEKRVLWNPKQEHRAYRRGFYAFPDPAGPHLAFSREMARENLIQLVNGVCYKRLPSEWKTAKIGSALEVLSKNASDWFETEVTRNLGSVGIVGRGFTKQVNVQGKSVQIPSGVGEIDFLGMDKSHNLLVIVEAKMTFTGLEAKYWRDDLEAFVTGRDSYATKFRRKVAWVEACRNELAGLLGLETTPQIAAAMVTLYPCIAEMFIPDFPCISLAELMLDFKKDARWPYPTR